MSGPRPGARVDRLPSAPCQRHDPEMWHATGEDREDQGDCIDAKEFCMSCPVREQCLATALGDPHLTGIWGGTTTSERKSMLRRAARRRTAWAGRTA